MKMNETQIHVPLPADTKARLREAAQEEGMTLSTYVRNLVMRNLKEREKSDGR